MAEEEKTEEEQAPENTESTESTGEQKSSGSGLFAWLIIGAIVLGCAVGGFALAQLVAGQGAKPTEPEPPEPTPFIINTDGQPWQYDLPPVIGNLDEPGVTRYLRVTTTLVISGELDEGTGMKFLDGESGVSPGKKDILVDFMSDYISGLTLERVRGQKNRRRIKKEVTEGFNEVLFPGSKPFITTVLFKEFAVQ